MKPENDAFQDRKSPWAHNLYYIILQVIWLNYNFSTFKFHDIAPLFFSN